MSIISGAASRKDADEGWMDGQTLLIKFCFSFNLFLSPEPASSQPHQRKRSLSTSCRLKLERVEQVSPVPPPDFLLVHLKWTFQSHRVLLKHEHVRTKTFHINWFIDGQIIKNNLYIQVKLQVIDQVILWFQYYSIIKNVLPFNKLITDK